MLGVWALLAAPEPEPADNVTLPRCGCVQRAIFLDLEEDEEGEEDEGGEGAEEMEG